MFNECLIPVVIHWGFNKKNRDKSMALAMDWCFRHNCSEYFYQPQALDHG